jgi:hypothetical protein
MGGSAGFDPASLHASLPVLSIPTPPGAVGGAAATRTQRLTAKLDEDVFGIGRDLLPLANAQHRVEIRRQHPLPPAIR